MSRSNKNIRISVNDTPYVEPKVKYWVTGYKKGEAPKLQRQSKYSTNWVYKESSEYLDDSGDNKYSRWDLDNPKEDTPS